MFSLVFITLGIINVQAQGGENWDFNYVNNGVDWPQLVSKDGKEKNYCGEVGKQSPINFVQPIGSYGWAYGETLPMTHDNYVAKYEDLEKLSKIEWDDHSIGVKFHPTESKRNLFYSDQASKLYNCASSEFHVKEFKIKSESEHTINGIHYDLELQIFYDAAVTNSTSTVNHAAFGVMFSVNDYNAEMSAEAAKNIDSFFEDLRFNQKTKTVEIDGQIRFTKLMNSLSDLRDRWIYEGSFTEPPCTPGVYWNVDRTVYPIPNDRFESIKEKMAFMSNQHDPEKHTYQQSDYDQQNEQTEQRARTPRLNYFRKLQKIVDQHIRYTSAKFFGSLAALLTGLTSVFAITQF